MTASQLQNIANRLGNCCWCRHWLHWNYPQQAPRLMALNCREADGSEARIYGGDLERAGFRKEVVNGATYWVIERTNEDGTPFVAELLV